jgi:hypothetical protein
MALDKLQYNVVAESVMDNPNVEGEIGGSWDLIIMKTAIKRKNEAWQ